LLSLLPFAHSGAKSQGLAPLSPNFCRLFVKHGAAESPPGAGGGFPRGDCEVWGVIAGRGVGGGLFGVCNLKRFSDSEKLQPLLLLPFVGFNFSFAGQELRTEKTEIKCQSRVEK